MNKRIGISASLAAVFSVLALTARGCPENDQQTGQASQAPQYCYYVDGKERCYPPLSK